MTTAPTTPALADDSERGSHSVQRLVPHHGQTHLDLFSGIGGFAIAAACAGFKTIGFSEIEPYACKVLKQNWPDVPNYGDIRNVRGVRADLLTGGFPCQPFSVAGKRLGKKDDRHLWPEMCRVIAETRPTWVLGENVPGIIGMELDGVLSDLESLGYSAWPLVIPACGLDARHRRNRLWILANADETRRGEQRRAEPVGTKHAAAECGCKDVADAERNRCNRPRLSEKPREGISIASGCGENISRTGQANGYRWPTEPRLGRVADGIPNRSHRLKGLGNAIVPQVAAEILTALVMGNS